MLPKRTAIGTIGWLWPYPERPWLSLYVRQSPQDWPLASFTFGQWRTADDTEKRQLRAYIGPVFNGFRLTTRYADCEPSATAIAPHVIFCSHIQNYGLTPAR